jgi:hypothetical protein
MVSFGVGLTIPVPISFLFIKRYYPGVVPKKDKKNGFFNYSWHRSFLACFKSRFFDRDSIELRYVQ